MFDTIIVGAGAVGMMTAQLLSQQGQKVCLIDKGKVGSESSWAGGGILSPLYPWQYSDAVNNLATWSQQHYPDFFYTLIQETGIDVELINSGLLIRIDEQQKSDIQRWSSKYNPSVAYVNAVESLQIESSSAPVQRESLWLANVSQVRNPRLVRALHQSMINNTITLYENCEVLSVSTTSSRFNAVQTTTGKIVANHLVIASGAWSSQLFNDIGQHQTSATINPVRGQMMIIKTPPDTLKRIILEDGHYVIPRKDGRVLIGSTIEHVGFDKSITDDAHDKLLQAAIAIVPSLSQFKVEHHWAGLRPGTLNGVPYISQHPEISGVFINSGHYRNGIILGLASAQLMVNIMLGQPEILNISDYRCEK